jgi:peptidyl-prolyl cis-trans isomerase SurA
MLMHDHKATSYQRSKIRISMKFRCLILSAAIGMPLLAADVPAEKPVVVEEIIAKVNGDIVTTSDMDHQRKAVEAEMKQRGITGADFDEKMAEFNRTILSDRIDQLLLQQKGKELNINVDPEVSKQMAEIQKMTGIADPDKFQESVREQTGQSYEDYKNEIKNNLMTQKVIRQEIGGRIQISTADIEKYYNEHKTEFVRQEQIFLREILISTEGKNAAGVAAAEKKAKDLVARARKGERFGELARDNSDAVTAKNYGDLGTPFKRGELNKQLEDAVWDKDKGYVTDPIKLPNGLLILKVEEKYKAGQASLEEVRDQIMEKLYVPRMQPAIRDYLTKLRVNAFLEIKPGYVDASAAPGKDTNWRDPAQLKPETTTKEEVVKQNRKKKFLGIPVPGTSTSATGTSSSR